MTTTMHNTHLQEVIDQHYAGIDLWVQIEGWPGGRLHFTYGTPATITLEQDTTIGDMTWWSQPDDGELLFGPCWAIGKYGPTAARKGDTITLPNRITIEP